MMQSVHNDEDWSIISSSSDMDDDQSTGSSALGSSKELSLDQDKEVSSVGTLKLPVIAPDFETTNRIETANGPKRPIVEPIIEDTSENKDRHIDNVIRFYENLSFKTGKWNDSIKQKSSEFYQNVAKLKFEQFNKFMSSKDNIDSASAKSNDNKDLKENIGAFDILEIPEAQPEHEDRKYKSNCAHLKLATLQDFLDENSEYLFYYFVSSILGVVSLLGLYYNVNWNSILYQKQQPTPSVLMTTMSYFDKTAFKCRNYLEDLFYEDSYPTSKYFGLYQVAPSKTIKFSRRMNIWREYDFSQLIQYLNTMKWKGISNYRALHNYICQIESTKLIPLHRHFKLHCVNLYELISSELHQIPRYIKLANTSLFESVDKYWKKNSMGYILHNAKFNFDKSARYIYRSSYPLRKFVADSMNV